MTWQELARLNAELAKEREKFETLAKGLSDEYEHIKQWERSAAFCLYTNVLLLD